MALPSSRDITLAQGTQIPSTLLNNLQDMIIGGKTGPEVVAIPGSAGVPAGASPDPVNPSGDIFGSRWDITVGQFMEITFPVTVAPGDRITDFRGFGEILTAADQFSVQLLKRDASVATGSSIGVIIGTTNLSPTTVGFKKVGQAVSPAEVVVADTSYWIYMTVIGTAGAGGMRFYHAQYTRDRL